MAVGRVDEHQIGLFPASVENVVRVLSHCDSLLREEIVLESASKLNKDNSLLVGFGTHQKTHEAVEMVELVVEVRAPHLWTVVHRPKSVIALLLLRVTQNLVGLLNLHEFLLRSWICRFVRVPEFHSSLFLTRVLFPELHTIL